MKSLLQYVKESSLERWSLKTTLKNFLENSIKNVRFPMSKFKSMIIDSLNKYSDGGPRIEDWLESSQSQEVTFTAYIESISGKERITIEIQDPRYDMMKMCFDKNDNLANKMFEYIKIKGKKL